MVVARRWWFTGGFAAVLAIAGCDSGGLASGDGAAPPPDGDARLDLATSPDDAGATESPARVDADVETVVTIDAHDGGAPVDEYDAGPGDVGLTIGACEPNGWCLVTPLQQTGILRAVWGSGRADVWAVGDDGLMLHWDGASWSHVPSGTDKDLRAVWGSGRDDAWAVGDGGTILHWNGLAWMDRSTPVVSTLRGVWGSSASDVWVVGGEGVVLRWNGATWSSAPTGGTSNHAAIWGTSANDVWITDAMGVVRWDGARWNALPVTTGAYIGLTAITGSGPKDVWLSGDREFLAHWDGSTWTRFDQGYSVNPSNFPGVWSAGANDVWMLDGRGTRHWNGAKWTTVRDGLDWRAGFTAVWGSASDDVWAVGGNTIIHWSGKGWSPVVGSAGTLEAVWGSGPNDVWLTGVGGTALHWDGKVWASFATHTTATLRSLWGSGPNDVWAVGDPFLSDGVDGPLLHWDGNAWLPSGVGQVSGALTGVWGSGPNDVWTVGSNGIFHLSGQTWSRVAVQATGLTDVWGSGPNDVWAVGSGNVLHWDGTAWTSAAYKAACAGDQSPSTVWGSGPRDVWFGGKHLLRQLDGVWFAVPDRTDSPVNLTGIWGTGSNDVWMAGQYAMYLEYWNGVQWRWVGMPSRPYSLYGVWGTSAADVWAVGEMGNVVHRSTSFVKLDGGVTPIPSDAAVGDVACATDR